MMKQVAATKFIFLAILSFSCSIATPVTEAQLATSSSDPREGSSPAPVTTSTVGSTNSSLPRHKLLKIQAKPKTDYSLPKNSTLMITGDSTMHVFDYHEIMHPRFDPSAFLNQATKESTQKINVPLNYGQQYFIFLPPALIKEYQLFTSRRQRRRRVKRHHPSILQSVLGQLQNYALVPIQSNNGNVRYILLKNPKFVISGVGPGGTPITASVPVTQQPKSLAAGQAQQHHHGHSLQAPKRPNTPSMQATPKSNSGVLPQILDIMSPMTIAPKAANPTSRPWTRSRSRTPPLTRNNRPLSASTAKKAILGERFERPIPVPAAGPIDSLFNENLVTKPAVQMRHVHSHSRGHVQRIQSPPNVLPRVDALTQTMHSSAQSASISSSSSSGSPSIDASSIVKVEPAPSSSSTGSTASAGAIDSSGTHTVHQTEIVETVIETKNAAAAVAKTDTAAVANKTTSVGTKKDASTGTASQTSSSSSAASASTAVAAKQEKVVSTKKTTKTTKIKQGTDAGGKPTAVHEVTEVVEHTAAKTGAATATKTDAVVATATGSATVKTKGGKTGTGTVDTSSAAAASSSAAVTSNNATTTVKKKTIKKTIVTKTAASSPDKTVPVVDTASASITKSAATVDTQAATVTSDNLVLKALDSAMPPVQTQKKNKKPAKTAILSENNDRQAVGIKAALIATPKPKLVAPKVMKKATEAPIQTTTAEAGEEQMTTVGMTSTTEEVELEDIITSTMATTIGQYGYPVTMTAANMPHVAGWASGPTTESPLGLGPMDRINTTDVPEEIEARPDKTPAEMRRELAKLNPNLPKNSPALRTPKRKRPNRRPVAQRNSRQRSAPPKEMGPKGRQQRNLSSGERPLGRRRNRQGRRGNRNSRNNPRSQSAERRRLGPRPRTRDPLARWLWNNLETGEMFENMPFWMFLK